MLSFDSIRSTLDFGGVFPCENISTFRPCSVSTNLFQQHLPKKHQEIKIVRTNSLNWELSSGSESSKMFKHGFIHSVCFFQGFSSNIFQWQNHSAFYWKGDTVCPCESCRLAVTQVFVKIVKGLCICSFWFYESRCKFCTFCKVMNFTAYDLQVKLTFWSWLMHKRFFFSL